MGYLLMILDLIEYMLLTIIIKAISNFLSLSEIILFSLLVAIFAGFIFVKGIKAMLREQVSVKIGKQIFKPLNLCFFSIMIMVSLTVIECRNIFILINGSENSSVFTLARNSSMTQKSTEQYNAQFAEDKYNNITVLYKSDIKPALPLVYEYIKKVENDCTQVFGKEEAKPLEIKFDYDEKMFKRLKPTKEDYAGLYSHNDRRINIYVEDCYEDILALNMKSSNFRHVVFHEYGHYRFDEFLERNKISSEAIPLWFYEGVGEYIGWEGANGYPPKVIVNFSELTDDKGWVKYFDDNYNIYEQSHFAVSELIMQKGKNVVQELLYKTKISNFDNAFQDIMGFSVDEYQNTLQADMKNGWKRYYRMITASNYKNFEINTRIACLEEYTKNRSDNISALLDLDILYRNTGEIDKAKEKCIQAVEKMPENSMAWHRLALISEEISDFDTALKAFEKVVELDDKNANSYINLAQVLLLYDIDKAAASAEKAKNFDNSSYVTKQILEMITFKNSIENGKPYEGCLRLIKSDTILSDKLKKALILKVSKEYPGVECDARIQLERLASGLK